jgi:PBSX family phage terminase large subunit
MNSTPTLEEFNPHDVPYQFRVIEDIRKNFDYSQGHTHEILLSGSVGSAKSILCAHIVVTHCLFNMGARVLIGRESMKDLKNTILKKILEHIGQDVEYEFNKTTGQIIFENGSEIIPYSWGDQKITKVRSLELSAAMIEELTENDSMDFYHEIRARVGRLQHIKESFIISATNPGGKSSEFYKYFIEPSGPRRHVYYSVTTDNKFLEPGYVQGLLDTYDSKTAERMIYGKWIDLETEVVYYAYSREFNYIDKSYEINPSLPTYMTFDFNIGDGKPLSVAFIQHTPDASHIYNEVVVDGQRTLDACEEAMERGLLSRNHKIIINGDASGRSRDTRGKQSDYAIIEKFMANSNLRFEIDVPTTNPRVRDRHNLLNGRICNANNKRSLFVYKDAPTADEAFRMTSLKKGGQYVEDDSKRFQHIGTAIGYSVCSYLRSASTSANQVQALTRFGVTR